MKIGQDSVKLFRKARLVIEASMCCIFNHMYFTIVTIPLEHNDLKYILFIPARIVPRIESLSLRTTSKASSPGTVAEPVFKFIVDAVML